MDGKPKEERDQELVRILILYFSLVVIDGIACILQYLILINITFKK